MKNNSTGVITPSTKLLLTLSMIKGVGPVLLKKAASSFLFSSVSTIDELSRFDPKLSSLINDEASFLMAKEKAEKQIEYADKYSFRIISILDDDYPKLLSETKDDPCLLYVQGRLFNSPDNSVAIIGTREPTYHGKLITERITKFFVEKNWSIVSGLAIGCDGIAHETALNCHGHTIAVLAHGLQTIAPTRHKKLAYRIVEEGGALITEYPFGQDIQRQQYVKRDRIQAGLARGVVMIQSDIKGGSLHASRASLDYNRWLAVPYPTKDDAERNEPKAQANLLIANGSDFDKVKVLNFDKTKLGNIIVLNGKDDYDKLIDNLDLEKKSKDVPFVADMFDSLNKSDESYIEKHSGYGLQEINPNNEKRVILDKASGISNQTEKALQNKVAESGEVKTSKVDKLIVSSDFTFDFNSVIKKATISNKELISKLSGQEEKLQLIKLRLKIISKNLKSLHENKFYEVKDIVNSLKNKLIIESILINLLSSITLCDFESADVDEVVLLKDKIKNILLNFPGSIIFCDTYPISQGGYDDFDNNSLVELVEKFNFLVFS
ncbi:DNA-processing protein DprA [Yersinia enterocolitica]